MAFRKDWRIYQSRLPEKIDRYLDNKRLQKAVLWKESLRSSQEQEFVPFLRASLLIVLSTTHAKK